MKKILSVFLASFMCLSGLTACSKHNSNGSVDSSPTEGTKAENQIAGVDYTSEKKYIVKDNEALYDIVISEAATPAEENAAQELASLIQSSLGVSLDIISDAGITINGDADYISIGETKILDYCNFDVDYDSLNDEGFFIKTKEDLIVMNGANERAKIYAVYDFLEKFIGIRFLTAEVTHIPKLTELYVHSMDIMEAPAFIRRDIFGSTVNGQWENRLRVSRTGNPREDKYGGSYYDEEIGFGHSFHTFLPPEQYKADHPDWYAGSDGKQLCLTNQGVVDELIKVLSARLVANPKAKYIMLAQEDGAVMCRCDTCAASHQANGGESGSLIIFLNKVIQGLEAWVAENDPGREFWVRTMAYESTYAPPVKKENGEYVPYNDKVIPNDKLIVQIAATGMDYFHELDDPNSKQNVTTYNQLKGWHALDCRLLAYDYGVCFSAFLYYYASIGPTADRYQEYLDLGVESIIMQLNDSRGTGVNEFQHIIKSYVFSKLMWNPKQDVNVLIEEFCTLYFGEDVAPYIINTMTMFEAYYATQNFFGALNFLATPEYSLPTNIPLSLLTQTISMLDEAEAVVRESSRTEEEQEELITRIARWKVTPQYMLLSGYDTYYLSNLAGKRIVAEEFFENCDRTGIIYYCESGENTIRYLKSLWLN